MSLSIDEINELQAGEARLITMVAVRDDLIAETTVELEQALAEKERLLNLLVDRESLIAEYIMTEEQAQTRVTALEEAAQVIYEVATTSWSRSDAISCPHGNIPFYPAHGVWCDNCFERLGTALAAPAREGDADGEVTDGVREGTPCSRCRRQPQKIGTLCVSCLEDDGVER